MKYTAYHLPLGFALTLLFTCLISSLMAQQVSANKKGDLIITMRDGSWRPVKPSDSLLVRQYYLQNPPTKGKKTTDTTPQAQKYKEENKVSSSDTTVHLNETGLNSRWNELVLVILEEEKKVQKDFRDATNAQFKASEQLSLAKANKNGIPPEQLIRLQKEYDQCVSALRMAKREQNEVKKLVDVSRTINANISTLSEKKYTHVLADYNVFIKTYQPGSKPVIATDAEPAEELVITATPPAPDPVPEVITIEALDNTSSSPLPAEPTISGNRPADYRTKPYVAQPYACVFVTDSIEYTTKSRRLELQPDLLFTYTDPDLRPYFRDKEFMTCRAMLSRIDSYTYLSVEFQIATTHTQNNFGALDNGSLLRLKLMNGEQISLHNLKASTGRIDAYTGNTVFTGQYALGKTDLKKLGTSELDTIRVLWTTGYEDYDVYNVDFLIRQIHCLTTKK